MSDIRLNRGRVLNGIGIGTAGALAIDSVAARNLKRRVASDSLLSDWYRS